MKVNDNEEDNDDSDVDFSGCDEGLGDKSTSSAVQAEKLLAQPSLSSLPKPRNYHLMFGNLPEIKSNPVSLAQQ